MAVAQLSKAHWIIEDRRALARELTEMVKGIPSITPPVEDFGCTHVYYIWAAMVMSWRQTKIVGFLNANGFPMNAGYSPLLSRVFATNPLNRMSYPIAEQVEDRLMTFDVCSYSPTKRQKRAMKDLLEQATEL